ncbi:MAG: circularly permuted type 2 ATP-grasp protein [Gemmatimonadales bacterium]|nr:circularly permuted type 2 ATP-grasp protein [Gemmatimonadales bacterium]
MPPESLLARYAVPRGASDELIGADGQPTRAAREVLAALDRLGAHELRVRKRLSDDIFRDAGVTFAVYGEGKGVERIFPFDPVPRIVTAAEWARLERGLLQRVEALDRFLDDIYGAQRILQEKRVPRDLLAASRGWVKAVAGIRPPGGTRIHIAGIDLIRSPDGECRVLEDNVRTPSGVSYVLENRMVMKRVYPQLFRKTHVRTVEEYPARLREALESVAPADASGRPRTVLLTPGPYNSAYFEHSFLARRMGIELVQGSDLFVHRDRVYVKTTQGPQRVHVIYRRIDDAFLDPEAFRKDSMLGVPGLVRAWAGGHVTLANAIGNGIADDKAVYPFVPEMIRFYLGEEPVLPQVDTYICARDADRAYVLEHLHELVVKSVDEAGGYGMLMGPQASGKERQAFAAKIRANPRGFIAQPLVQLSTCPTLVGADLQPRRVDLRPYVVGGADRWVLPGGLTRVALRKGSYVVNSSQGGGSKDTWVLASSAAGGESVG